MSQTSQCIGCKRFWGFRQCEAFPEEIPTDIWTGAFDHREPHPDDHGLQHISLDGSDDQSETDLPGAEAPDRNEVAMDEIVERVAKEVRFLVPIEKAAPPKRVTYGVVLEPDTEDLQGDIMTAEDIEEAAYDWMERSQAGGHMHSQRVDGAKVVESYIAPCDIRIETAGGFETIRKGSWVLAMRWPEDIWENITKGVLAGYSVGGTGVRLALDEVNKRIAREGDTWVVYSEHGRVLGRHETREEALAQLRAVEAAKARREEDVAKKGKWVPGPNAHWQRLDDAEDDERPDRKPKTSGTYRKGDVVRFKEDGSTGLVVDHEPGKDGSPDEYAIAPHDREEGGPRAIWVREDEIEGVDDEELDAYPSGTADDEDRYPTGGKWPGETEPDDVDLVEVFDGTEGKTVTLDGRKYVIREVKPFKYTRGVDALVLEPKDKNSEWYQETRRQLGDDWYHEVSDPERLVQIADQVRSGKKVHKSLTSIVAAGLREAISKHGHHDQKTHGNWAHGGGGADEEPKKHVTRDGVVVEDQPKVTRVGGEQYRISKPEGEVILNFGEWTWTGPGRGKPPKVTERGSWAVWPRGKKHNVDNLIHSTSRTLAELMRDLPPGEYDLAP